MVAAGDRSVSRIRGLASSSMYHRLVCVQGILYGHWRLECNKYQSGPRVGRCLEASRIP